MARKKSEQEGIGMEERISKLEETIETLSLALSHQGERIEELATGFAYDLGVLEERMFPSRSVSGLNKTEAWDPAPVETYEQSRLKMNREDQMLSAANAIRILPPNRLQDGRARREDVQAIVGFSVDQEFLNEVYRVHFKE